jgi:N,N'-diacetyllegionaminate synthase
MFEFSKKFLIEDFWVGEDEPVYLIAEAGISHFGDEKKAYELVDIALDGGANAVKFQVFDIDEMFIKENKEWRDRLGPRSLSFESFIRIQKYCKEKGITFFATAHDVRSLNFLSKINVPVYKIGSGELGNIAYFREIAKKKKPVIFSTGMYEFSDIQNTLNIFKEEKNRDISVLHCVTSYPTPPKDASILNILKINTDLGIITGYSDHTQGYHIPLAAVALGAKIIEKHITIDFNIPNAQDWKVSCGPDNFKTFVSQVRDVENSLSLRESGPTRLENENKIWATKSLVLKKVIKKGSVLQENHLTAKRPGTGISPSFINHLIGRVVNKDIDVDALLKWEDFE